MQISCRVSYTILHDLIIIEYNYSYTFLSPELIVSLFVVIGSRLRSVGCFRWCYHHPAPQKKKSESDSAGRSECVKFPSVECADFLPCTLYVSNHYDNCFQFDYRVVVGPAFRAPHCKGAVAHSHHFPGASPILGRAPFPLFSVCRGFSRTAALVSVSA